MKGYKTSAEFEICQGKALAFTPQKTISLVFFFKTVFCLMCRLDISEVFSLLKPVAGGEENHVHSV